MPLHQFTTGVQAPFGFQPTVPYPVDSWSGPYAGASTADAIALANSTIAGAIRFLSLEVRILAPDPGNAGQTLAYKYWYRGSTANDGLVEFSSAAAAVAGASLGANTFTGLNTFNAGITTAFIYASTGSTFGGTLQVNGGTTLGARVDVGGILDVAGGVTLESTLDVSSVAKFNSNVTLGDESTDIITVNGRFIANVGITANAGITTSFIYASTGSTFGGTLQVNGGATFATTDHSGVARFAAGLTTSTLDVTTVSKFAGGATFASTVAVVGGLSATSLYASTGSTFAGTLKVVGGATFDSRVDVAGILDVAGGVTLETTLDVGGVAKFVGGVTFQSTTDHAVVARFAAGLTTSAIDVAGTSKFNGNITLGDAAADTITATGTFQGLTVSNGLLIANAGITTSSIYASTGSTFGARVDVAGILDVVGGVTFENTSDHAGVARFASGITSSTLDVANLAKFNGNVTVGDNAADVLTVTSGATFGITDHAGVARFAAGLTTSTLDVSGAARFAGGSTFSGIAAFTSGITTSSIYASTGSTFGARVDVAGILDVVGGTTLENTLDVGGVARFAVGITTSTLNASAAIRANGGLTASTLDVEGVSKFAGGATFSSSADFAVGLTSSGNVVVGSAGTVLKTNGDVTIGKTLTVNGNFFVTGTVTTVNRTDLAIDDKIITLGRTLGDDTLADDGGLILVGDDDIKLTWRLTSDAWTSSRNFNVNTGSGYKVSNTTALAVGMVQGLSASAGIITGGTWAANIIGLAYGGTNKNLAAVGASGGVVYKDGTGLTITAAGSNGQILSNSSGTPVWVNTTSLTGITADRVKTTATNTAGTYYLTFVTAAADSTDLYVDTTTGVTYDASTGMLSCTQIEAIVDGGTW
jgi:hypothetical protein